MKKLQKFIKKNWFLIAIYLILILAIFLRTYNLPARIGMGSDSTRDVIIAQEALRRHEIPLIGSFSSAGPFVFGPLYFWFNMFALTIMPFSFKSPWILMNIVGVLTVVVGMITGYRVGGRRLSLVVGLIVCCCPQFVSRSTGLSQHSLVGITTALLVLFFVLFYQTRKIRYAFLMGISIGIALSMHYQALNLLIFLPTLFLIPKVNLKTKFLAAIMMSFGVIIPSIPLMYWDSMQEFANIRNVMDYMLLGQYRLYVANSWRIYLGPGGFLPDYWSNVVGGNKPVTYFVMGITAFTLIYMTLKRKIQGEIFFLGIILTILLVIIRYYNGVRFDGYMIYVAPLMFLICGWAFVAFYDIVSSLRIIKKSRTLRKGALVIAFILFAVVIISDLKNASQFVLTKSEHEKMITAAKEAIVKKYPNQKFQLYDYYWRSSDNSYLLGEQLMNEGKISKNGIPIGFVLDKLPVCSPAKPIFQGPYWQVFAIEDITKLKIKKPEWSPVNPPDVYDDLMKWQKTEKLKTTFNPLEYIQSKLHLN